MAKENNKYKYQIGEVVNNTLRIVDYTQYGKNKQKGYIVQSLVFPDAPTYATSEVLLVNGTGCGYRTGKRLCEGNSLYSIKHIRKYLTDLDGAKKISKGNSTSKIEVRCTECGLEKLVTPASLVKSGMHCPLCSKGTSYPELFMLAYLEVKGIYYEYQKGFKGLPRRKYDFYLPNSNLVIETHGKQHYEENEMWDFLETNKSDFIKEFFCLKNNIGYLALPTTDSTFESMIETVNNSVLTSITENEHAKILDKISHNNKYPVKKMISLYEEGYSTRQIGEKLGIQQATTMYILKKHNINTSLKRRVRCTTTGEEFDSISEAMKKYPTATSISRACKLSLTKKRGRGTSGTLPDYKPLKWEFVDEERSRPRGKKD